MICKQKSVAVAERERKILERERNFLEREREIFERETKFWRERDKFWREREILEREKFWRERKILEREKYILNVICIIYNNAMSIEIYNLRFSSFANTHSLIKFLLLARTKNF